MQILWAFRCNPLRSGSSKPAPGIAEQQFRRSYLPKAISCAQPGGRSFEWQLRTM
ncbi:MAG: hypothetical protein LBK44_00220 [Spirochaetales bacterium]|nr:hypothetical protein [Spirochaetales bacterium]